MELDVTAAGAAARIAAAAPEAEVLVNNVGHFLRPPTAFAAEDAAAWEAQRAINLEHVLAVTRAVLPGMIERGRGGSVVNLTTVEAFRGIPGHAVYSAYKAAVVAFGRSLALEVGEHGIRVNDIAPDVVETPAAPLCGVGGGVGALALEDLGAARPPRHRRGRRRRRPLPRLAAVELRHRHDDPRRRRHQGRRRLVPARRGRLDEPAAVAVGG